MKGTFGDFLGEGDDGTPDWMKVGNPDKLSIGDRASDENLYGSGKSGQFDVPSQKLRDAKARQGADMKHGMSQGPAINDVKVVLERLQKMELEFDSLASEVVTAGMDPSEIANELDGIRKRMSAMITTLHKAWNHLAVGGKPYHGKQ